MIASGLIVTMCGIVASIEGVHVFSGGKSLSSSSPEGCCPQPTCPEVTEFTDALNARGPDAIETTEVHIKVIWP